MNIIKIQFIRNIESVNAVDFTITDLRNDREWADSVRLNETSCSSPRPREALSTYGFWLDLKCFVGPNKPLVDCNDMNLLRRYYELYKTDTIRSKEPWPFSR
jgi:hypothetical protein